MSVRCPDGHTSESTDYCDVCGLPIATTPVPAAAPTSPLDISAPPVAAPPVAPDKVCPHCGTDVPDDDLFCENCGYDFTTGALPAPPDSPAGVPAPAVDGAVATSPPPDPAPPAPAAPAPSVLTWVAEVWVDPDWYETQDADEPCPSVGMPVMRPLWDSSVLVGRPSASRNIHPQVDCGADHGVSRRHVQLTTDGQRWWAEDLQSSNGTFISPAGAPLPAVPIPPGQRTEFAAGDRIHLGAWTRIVIRKATPDEQ